MRTDLTQAFINKKNAEASEPRTLGIFYFSDAGPVYFSDQELTVGAITYEALVSDWGTLEEAADPDSDNGEIRQQTITLFNSGDDPFTDNFLIDSPENVIVELYQWFDDLDPSDKVLIDRFVAQDPIEFDENSQTVSIDLVSLPMRFDAFVGDVISKASFPRALDQDLGKGIDYIVGSPGQIKTVKVFNAFQTNLDGPIVPQSTIINVRDDLTDWPAQGIIQVGEEKILYDSKTTNAFLAKFRGIQGTVASDHNDNDTVYQQINHVFYVGQGPIRSIDDVRVDDFTPPSGIYTVEPLENPARIVFSEQPYALRYSQTTDTETIGFDKTSNENTSFQAYRAYDNKPSTSAVINENFPNLIIEQVDQESDIGQISKVFLVISHWASNFYLNDRASVFIDNTLVGYLDRPSSSDNLILDAQVTLDHEHLHNTGDFHTHTHDDGSYSAAVEPHQHALLGVGTEIIVPTSTTLPFQVSNPGVNRFTDVVLSHSWSPPGGSQNVAYLEFVAFQLETEIEVFEGAVSRAYYSRKFNNLNQQIVLSPPVNLPITIRVHGTNVQGGYARVSLATLHITYSSSMEDARSAVTPFLSEAGDNRLTYNTNKQDDVNPLVDEIQDIDFVTKNTPTKVLETKFDITAAFGIPIDWDWFVGKKLKISYTGTADDIDLFITNAEFQVAVRKRERVYSDNVTCSPEALTINRPDIVIKLLLEKAGLSTSYIDITSFDAANQKYVNNNYHINGVISANTTVREAVRNITTQCRSRLIWTAGKAKLVFREFFENWSTDKSLLSSDLQLKSISARRQKVSDMINKLFVQYNKNWAKDFFRSAVQKQDNASIIRYGTLENRDEWNFDLVTDSTMAGDLAEFYLSILSTPSTFYDFNAYLNQFEVEKEDILEITSSGFNQIVKLPVVVRAANRIFGSGESGQINLINFIVESLRFIKKSKDLSESVTVSDVINFSFGLLPIFEDECTQEDQIVFDIEKTVDEYLSINDEIEFVADFNPDYPESITSNDNIKLNLNILLQDNVYASDIIDYAYLIGYGSGGYGIEAGYGGIIDLRKRYPDEVTLDERLVIDMNSKLEDNITAGDEIFFSDGYGSPKFGGYGTSYGN